MDSHRSWFPVILTGLSIALAAMIFAVYEPREAAPASSADSAPVTTPAPTSDEYQTAIRALLDARAVDGAQATLDALSVMRVPADYLPLHLQLVFTLNEYVAGNSEAGDARLDVLRATNTWLP